MSAKTVARCLRRQANKLGVYPMQKQYDRVIIDGFWTFVGKRNENKRWFLYAYAPETDAQSSCVEADAVFFEA